MVYWLPNIEIQKRNWLDHKQRPQQLHTTPCPTNPALVHWIQNSKKALRNTQNEKSREDKRPGPRKYGSHTVKAAEIQALNTKMFYDLIMLKRLPYISVFVYLVSKYNIILKNIASLSKPILCTIMTLQKMIHWFITEYGDSSSKYGCHFWALSLDPPPQGLGKVNRPPPAIWSLVSTSWSTASDNRYKKKRLWGIYHGHLRWHRSTKRGHGS